MSDAPRIDWYPSDWIAGTRHLTLEERAVYHDLLMLIYEEHGALREEYRRLARRIGTTPKRLEKTVAVLVDEGKLWCIDGFITNERAENELKKRENVSEKARASAKARWAKERRKPKDNNDDPMRSQCESNAREYAHHSLPTKREKEKAAPSPKRGSRLPDDWLLPREWGEWAVTEGMDELSVRREAEKFRDYWHSLPGQRGVKLDWLATWRNWIRKAMERHPTDPKPFDVRKALGG